jgi:hypothetical protein
MSTTIEETKSINPGTTMGGNGFIDLDKIKAVDQ